MSLMHGYLKVTVFLIGWTEILVSMSASSSCSFVIISNERTEHLVHIEQF